ncbi:hypothetical protein [Phaffia rhodozyma]|uniref:AB hydrolase-1 domain-containing protein n=1 Tax=Phaffia rhodozyma TaxID=264483 RepID=A0A0F7STH2_PHARH|nr:hypothetical protein [Phaffia rhodozyma]
MTAKLLQIPQIEARIVFPSNPDRRKLAVIAHPWARLGGSWDDRVVRHVLQIFLSVSVPTVIFNSRGAGESTKSPSWTGRGEADDYAEVLKAGMDEVWSGTNQGSRTGEVFICGYSHGALLALAQPPCSDPLRTFYVIISPPLSYKWFLTPTLRLLPVPLSPPLSSHSQLLDRPTVLVFHGTSDMFASIRAVRDWVRSAGNESVVRLIETVDGDHFWRSPDGLLMMDRDIRAWLAQSLDH